jgi:hypothetical protein
MESDLNRECKTFHAMQSSPMWQPIKVENMSFNPFPFRHAPGTWSGSLWRGSGNQSRPRWIGEGDCGRNESTSCPLSVHTVIKSEEGQAAGTTSPLFLTSIKKQLLLGQQPARLESQESKLANTLLLSINNEQETNFLQLPLSERYTYRKGHLTTTWTEAIGQPLFI